MYILQRDINVKQTENSMYIDVYSMTFLQRAVHLVGLLFF